MRYFIFTNLDQASLKVKEQIFNTLQQHSSWIYDEENPEIIFSIGGDGCMLRCIHQYLDHIDSTSFIGISTGKLGFLCDFHQEELEEALKLIVQNTPKIQSHSLIECSINNNKYHFLNEVRIERIFHTLTLDVFINGTYFETFKGNGLNFSTSIGSTAYNRSLNGPIINPNNDVVIMGEIAPLHHVHQESLNSFLLLEKKDIITLKGSFNMCYFGGDTYCENLNDTIHEITIQLSNQKIKFAHFKEENYYLRLQKSYIKKANYYRFK